MGLVHPTLFVISAPSGSGKTTLVKRALDGLPFVELSVSTTTRLPRPNEIEGVDYHFTHAEDFLHSIAKGEFLEWAEVYSSYYGTSKSRLTELQTKGKSVLVDIDVQGAMQLQQMPDCKATYLFIKPPSIKELENRLVGRGTETPASLIQRIKNAKHELTFVDRYDHVILNDDLDQATVTFLSALIQHSVEPSVFSILQEPELFQQLGLSSNDRFTKAALALLYTSFSKG